jgi:hypothetical protein
MRIIEKHHREIARRNIAVECFAVKTVVKKWKVNAQLLLLRPPRNMEGFKSHLVTPNLRILTRRRR